MKKLLDWFITSSVDPRKTSLAIKGFIVMIAPIAMAVLGITETEADTLGTLIADVVFYGLTLLSVVMTLIGLVRKTIVGRWSAVRSSL